MKMFVTGGAGFIGSNLVDRLIEDHQVTVYDNLSSGQREFIKPHLNKAEFTFVNDDLLDFQDLRTAMKGHDMVWHLAANPDIRAAIAKPSTDLKQGIQATFNVLDSMRINDIDKIAFSSSSVVYGEAKTFPTPEDHCPPYLYPQNLQVLGRRPPSPPSPRLTFTFSPQFSFLSCGNINIPGNQ